MGKMMLICVLLSASLPLTTTEVSTVPPPRGRPTTQVKPEATPDTTEKEVHTTKTVPPTVKAIEIVTSFAASPSAQQNPTKASLEATTIYATKDIQTTTIYNKMATTSKDLATPTIEKAEISTPANNDIPSTNSSTPSGVIITVQTSTTSTEPTKVATPTETPTTRVVPTAKLSATTQSVPGAGNATTKQATTAKFAPTTTELTTLVQNTTMKLTPTTRKTPPAVVTQEHATTSSKAKTGEDAKKSSKHGKIVAGLIGGALIAMMIGFLVILYKKHKLKKHQIATTDWAGPTPFLETVGDGKDNSQVTLRSANRISLTSFLPQRFSKRMSLLAETEEEMQDMQEMTTGTTFVAKDEKNGKELNQNLETSAKEAKENNSVSSEKTEEVVLVDETKEDDGETGKEKANGEAAMKDGQNGQLQNAPTQPVSQEDAPDKTKDENKDTIKDDGDKAG